MSKKTRKKSSTKPAKTPPRKTTAAKPVRAAAKTSAKAPPAKAPKTAPKAVAKKSAKAAQSALTKESHKPASKQLKSKPAAMPPQESKPAPNPVAKPESKPELKAAATAGLVEGGKAPDFRLPRDGGAQVSLADYAGQKLVLFFYPRADTPGCTREAIDFTRLKSAFAESGTAVLGVSADTVKAQESFRDKHQLAVPLVSDEQHRVLEAYGAWGEKSMYGRTFLGILRTTVLIAANGRISRIWRNVRVDGHADEVLAAAQAI